MKAILLSIIAFFIFLFTACKVQDSGMIMTVNGPISPEEIGMTLTHEHILVDFIGADYISYKRWNKDKVDEKMTPFLLEVKELGASTFIECTPAYLGRDPKLLKMISKTSGMHIITNTGYYGAADNKFLPKHATSESADELAARWIREWEKGIEGTDVRPGFIKIGVMEGNLSSLHRKLVQAAARTHLKTGLTIASHTGTGVPAFAEIGVLYEEGVAADAFIWVHAQSERDPESHILAAKMGAWVSFDGLNDDNVDEYVARIKYMKDNNLLERVLVSHDAGWYQPAENNGGKVRGFTTLFTKLIPALQQQGFSEGDIKQLFILNPATAFTIAVRTNG